MHCESMSYLNCKGHVLHPFTCYIASQSCEKRLPVLLEEQVTPGAFLLDILYSEKDRLCFLSYF